MKCKIITVSLLLLLLITNSFWIYSTMDNGVTMSYHDDVTYQFANRIQKLTELCNHFIVGIPSDSIKNILTMQSKSDDIFEKDSAINAMWISIPISNRKATEIKNDDLVEEWSKANRQ